MLSRAATLRRAAFRPPAMLFSTRPKKNRVSGRKKTSLDVQKLVLGSKSVSQTLSILIEHANVADKANVAAAMHRMAKVAKPGFDGAAQRRAGDLRLERCATLATSLIPTFFPRQLSQVCWGVVQLGGVDAAADLLEKAAEPITLKIEKFEPRELASTLWAFAKAGVSAPALFQAAVLTVPKKLAEYDAPALTQTAWALSVSAPHLANPLFHSLAAEALSKMGSFKPAELADFALAFAKAGVKHEALFEAVAVESLKKLAAFKPQNLADVVWAFATAGVSAPKLFEAVAADAAIKASSFNDVNFKNVLWAYSTAKITAPLLLAAAQGRAAAGA